MIDIKHTPEGDLDLSIGDLTYTQSAEQHQKDILISDKGHFKETPTIGVGMLNFLQDVDPENMLRTIRKEFAKDGMKVSKISIQNENIQTNANY
ncbi:MAG: hypothetical protein RR328_04690 [Bacteroidales bacterium]